VLQVLLPQRRLLQLQQRLLLHRLRQLRQLQLHL
jgi:hypothetical protein